jgi:uroporphyrinogen decarboxylase
VKRLEDGPLATVARLRTIAQARGIAPKEEDQMTHRERVMAALNHQEPDRVPMDLGGSLASTVAGSAYPALRAELGLPVHEGRDTWKYAQLAEIEQDVRAALDVDIVHAPRATGAGAALRILSEDRFIDEWDVQWRKPKGGHYYIEHAPFEKEGTVQAVDRHRWPVASDIVQMAGVVESLKRLRTETDYAVSMELRGRVMSMGQFLRGFEDWMVDLAMNEPFVQALLERTTQIQIEANDIVLRQVEGLVDIVYTSDDLGGQNGPLFSPDCFRRLFRPHFQRIWEHARARTSAKLMHHCCGSAYAFMGDFVELGVQALNPVQVSAARMEPAKLKAEFGRHLTFWGGVDTRQVMPRGTPAHVRKEVARRIGEMAPGGGYILAAVHNLQPEVPPPNIVAMYKAGKELGRYPLESRRDFRE